MEKRLFFTGLFFVLLYGAISGRTILASHHKAQIAFISTRDGNPEIYVMDANGNSRIRLTNHQNEDLAPSWSPDGSRIAFASNRNDRNYQIYVMDSNKKNVRRLSAGINDRNPAWSPDGQKIAFHGIGDEEIGRENRKHKIYVAATDGTNLKKLAGEILSTDIEPAWSPDSQRIAFASWREGRTAEIYVMDANGENQRRLTHNMATNRSPAWSPDGRKIAFSAQSDEGDEDIIIAVMDADGNNRKNLIEEMPNGIWEVNDGPAWSSDSKMIAYTRVGQFAIMQQSV